MPAPPKPGEAPVYLGDDLTRVPEVRLEAPPTEASKLTTPQWIKRKAHAAAAALHLNAKEEDGFLKALVRSRPDLAGLPFRMGKDCRTDEDRSRTIKYTAQQRGRGVEPTFYMSLRYQRAHIAVMAQNLIGHDADGQPRALRAMTSTRHPEATRELARAAVFSPDEALRDKAVRALATRPAVAENAARAIVQLRRADLVPQLRAVLDEPDPRGPRTTEADGQKKTVAQEVVRVNHLRSCTLCHSPAEQGKTPDETLLADVPLPSEPLPSTGFYGDEFQRTPSRLANPLVRIDTTYLRQDFSAMADVPNAAPWPTKQRFDFLVRKRELTPTQAGELRKRLEGESPYHRAAALALRELTGRPVTRGDG